MLAVYITLGLIFVITLLVLFLCFPQKSKKANELKGLYIAHRGLHNNDNGIPENSLLAFSKAIEKGYAIENDIHLTADGRVVVFHDDTLLRVCGTSKRPEDMTLDEIKECSLFGTDQKIPTLEECLELIDGKVPLLIEFKSDSLIRADALCDAANNILKNYKGKYFIQSFYPFILRWYRKNNPTVLRGQLATAFKGEALHRRLLGLMLFNFIGRPQFISYEHIYKNSFMRRLAVKLGGYPVGWTFLKKEEIEASKKDFKAFIFENFEP